MSMHIVEESALQKIKGSEKQNCSLVQWQIVMKRSIVYIKFQPCR